MCEEAEPMTARMEGGGNIQNILDDLAVFAIKEQQDGKDNNNNPSITRPIKQNVNNKPEDMTIRTKANMMFNDLFGFLEQSEMRVKEEVELTNKQREDVRKIEEEVERRDKEKRDAEEKLRQIELKKLKEEEVKRLAFEEQMKKDAELLPPPPIAVDIPKETQEEIEKAEQREKELQTDVVVFGINPRQKEHISDEKRILNGPIIVEKKGEKNYNVISVPEPFGGIETLSDGSNKKLTPRKKTDGDFIEGEDELKSSCESFGIVYVNYQQAVEDLAKLLNS